MEFDGDWSLCCWPLSWKWLSCEEGDPAVGLLLVPLSCRLDPFFL